jgi:hypothetical protein
MLSEYKLTIRVTYDVPEGVISRVTDAGIRNTLEEAANHLAANGLLSEGLAHDIEVTTWDAAVTPVEATPNPEAQ